MALADYFERDLVAASQVIAGFDRAAFEARVGGLRVGIAWDADTDDSPAGAHLLDLSVRLLARFYPALRLAGPAGEGRDRLEALALAINPRIELGGRRTQDAGIVVGRSRRAFQRTIYAGADDWTARIGTVAGQEVGGSGQPFGAGVAAGLAAANLFRMLLLPDPRLDRDAGLSVAPLVSVETLPVPRSERLEDAVLIGAGAVGNAAAWALARMPAAGRVTLVDHETVELSNLQRYVLADRGDEGRVKVDVAGGAFGRGITPVPFPHDLGTYLEQRGHHARAMLLALDSAADRRAAQASLPRWIANAWTQANDLGVSVHPSFGLGHACVACLYLPDRSSPNEDELVAGALGIPDRIAEVRTLLHTGGGVTRSMLELITGRMQLPIELLAPYEGRPVRQLYVEGFCGGGVIPLGHAGAPRAELHVPLAHQSALAGILLAAAVTLGAEGGSPTLVTHLDPSRPVPAQPTHRARALGDGRCICEDRDYRAAWARKYRSDLAAVRRT